MTEIRSFRPEDEAAVVALWGACGLTRPWNDPHRDIERKQSVQADAFLVATCGTDVVGTVMAGYDGHRGWVNYLAVAPSQRRSGLGRRLMDAAEARLLAYGCPKINLQIRGDNSVAIGFYEAIGYRVDEVVSMGKRLVEDDAAT